MSEPTSPPIDRAALATLRRLHEAKPATEWTWRDLEDVSNALPQLLAMADQWMKRADEEVGWVIVDKFRKNGEIYYWSGAWWSKNNLDAQRFSRQVDAERTEKLIRAQFGVIVSGVEEHLWIR